MKTLGTLIAVALLATLVAGSADAQQPPASGDPHHPQSQTPGATPPSPPGAKPGAMPMMDMCRQMMGDMMTMSMMGGAAADPKEKADMLQMRGEMMKAMGEIMMKHGRRMQGPTGK